MDITHSLEAKPKHSDSIDRLSLDKHPPVLTSSRVTRLDKHLCSKLACAQSAHQLRPGTMPLLSILSSCPSKPDVCLKMTVPDHSGLPKGCNPTCIASSEAGAFACMNLSRQVRGVSFWNRSQSVRDQLHQDLDTQPHHNSVRRVLAAPVCGVQTTYVLQEPWETNACTA